MTKSFNLCQHCGKVFEIYKLYWDHLQTHKIRNIPCDSCKKLFASAKTLSDHKFWLKYVVVDLESDVRGERLLECVIDFNSSNI